MKNEQEVVIQDKQHHVISMTIGPLEIVDKWLRLGIQGPGVARINYSAGAHNCRGRSW